MDWYWKKPREYPRRSKVMFAISVILALLIGIGMNYAFPREAFGAPAPAPFVTDSAYRSPGPEGTAQTS